MDLVVGPRRSCGCPSCKVGPRRSCPRRSCGCLSWKVVFDPLPSSEAWKLKKANKKLWKGNSSYISHQDVTDKENEELEHEKF